MSISINSNGNPGIVPPWLGKPVAPKPKNPGIVPPWLVKPAPGDKNPGIVPPWLEDHIGPVTPNAAVATTFVRELVDLSPIWSPRS